MTTVSLRGKPIMSRVWIAGVVFLLGTVVACGPSEAERRAEEARKQAEQAAAEADKATSAAAEAAAKAGSDMAKGVEEMAKGAEGFAKAMEGVAGAIAGAATAANGGKTVQPVSFRDLQTLLPSVSGWKMNKPRGERMTSPVAFSQTEATYSNGNQRVDLKIVDSGFHQILLAPWAMFLARGYERETDSGYEKSLELDGQPGFEKWNSNDRSGELNVVVAKRFLVTIEGDRLEDAKVMHEFMSKLDTTKLSQLK